MRIKCEWMGKLRFVSHINGFKVCMDAPKPFGEEQSPSPKQLLLSALCGCTGMDVISLLKKNKQLLDSLHILSFARIQNTQSHPMDYIHLKYLMKGSCDESQVLEAVRLSLSKYCTIASMISVGTQIGYEIVFNGRTIKEDIAHFQQLQMKVSQIKNPLSQSQSID